MNQINAFLDALYFNIINPFFSGLSLLLKTILITPFEKLHFPLLPQIILLALLLAVLSFLMRRLLKVEEKTRRFNENFTAKRALQQDLHLISDKYSRGALYRVTDEELNDEYNRFLAGHYARYVSIYLLPLFLMLAWVNSIFSAAYLDQHFNSPFVIKFASQKFGVDGLNITFCFLLFYICWLMLGFIVKRQLEHRSTKNG